MEHVKHLIDCKCIHPVFKESEEDVLHKFVVFSLVDESNKFIEHFAQCDNCGIVHRVEEVGKSSIMQKESMSNIPTIDELELELPEKLCNILKKYNCPLHVWQEAAFLLSNQKWGEFLVLTREDTGYGSKAGKVLHLNGESSYKIESFEDSFVVEF